MYFVEKTINDTFFAPAQLPENFKHEDTVFFDIEASGLSPKNSMVFLIGIVFFKKGQMILRQYYANTYEEEIEILANFIEDVQHFDIIYHFNGLSFDIPFVNERLIRNNISFQLSKENSFDIFQVVKKNKKVLGLESCKLRSVEQYMGIYREDDLSGKEVADLYNSFVQNQAHKIREKVLLHNEEDIINLYRILPILKLINKKVENKPDLKVANPTISNTDYEIVFHGNINLDKDSDLIVDQDYYSFTWTKLNYNFKLKFKILEGTLYHFFKEYRQYYYYPEIDQAVHKSIAKYYSQDERIQASADSCYTKQKSKYIKLPISYEGIINTCSENNKYKCNCLSLEQIQKHENNQALIDLFTLCIEKIIDRD